MLKLLLVFLGIPIGIALIVIGGISVLNESNLQSHGKMVEATVTQTQTNDQNTYDIRYEFHLNNDATAYSSSDAMGRRNLWETVPVLPTGKTVQVKYLPGNPWVNHPVSDTSNRVESASIGLGTGVLLALVGLFLLASDTRSWLKKRSSQVSASQ